MNEFNATKKDITSAEKIRRQYVSYEADKMEQLKMLDNKVKQPGQIVGSLLGVVGVLGMGGGMSLIMVWGNLQKGLILSIPCMIVALLSYPVYRLITRGRKKKYADEIYRLTDEVMGSGSSDVNK